MVPKMWDKPLWESVWLCLDPWDSVRLRTASTNWNVQRKYGPHELFFFLIKKEPISELVEFGPCVLAETVKACALIGLHMMAEENALRSDSDSSLEGCVLGELRVAGFPSFTVFRVPVKERGGAQAPPFNVVREMKEKECERRALLGCFGWPVSFGIIEV